VALEDWSLAKIGQYTGGGGPWLSLELTADGVRWYAVVSLQATVRRAKFQEHATGARATRERSANGRSPCGRRETEAMGTKKTRGRRRSPYQKMLNAAVREGVITPEQREAMHTIRGEKRRDAARKTAFDPRELSWKASETAARAGRKLRGPEGFPRRVDATVAKASAAAKRPPKAAARPARTKLGQAAAAWPRMYRYDGPVRKRPKGGAPERAAASRRRKAPRVIGRVKKRVQKKVALPREPVARAMALLGVREGFTRASLGRAFRARAARVHPDRVGPRGTQKMAQLSAAYHLLLGRL